MTLLSHCDLQARRPQVRPASPRASDGGPAPRSL